VEGVIMKLYYSPNLNPRVAVAVAKYLDASIEFVRADPQNPSNTETFKPLNPNALVPTLEEDDGKTLWEADAIACRLSMLMGANFWRMDQDMPEMIRWISWSTHHLNRQGAMVYFDRLICPKYGIPRLEPEAVEKAASQFARLAKILDAALESRTWLLGNTISYADFRVASCLPFAEAASLPLDGLANLQRWNGQLMEIEAWRDPFRGLPV
jgi:glutathione S-transferase